MKGKIMILAIVLALTLMMMPTVQAQDNATVQAQDNAQLTVNVLKYEPMPAQPGQYVTATLELENMGNEEAKDAAIKVVDQFPFTTISDDEAKEEIGTLKAQRSYVFNVKLKVSSEAVIGDNELKIQHTRDMNDAPWQQTNKNIRVKSNEATISIVDVNSKPEKFTAGNSGNVKITVKNTADVVLRDISMQLNLLRQEEQQTIELPFTPNGTSEEQRINKLNPDETETLTYTLNTDSETEPGYYKIPVTMNFFDEEGTKTQKTNIIGVAVKSQPQLEVFLDETTISQPQQQGTATIKFVNKGIHDLRFLDVELVEGEGYTILSSNKDYIGDLSSDDYRTQEFMVKTKKEDTNLNIEVSYKDNNNKDYEEMFKVPMKYTPQQENGNSGLSITLIIVAAVVLFFVIRGARKHNKKKKKRDT